MKVFLQFMVRLMAWLPLPAVLAFGRGLGWIYGSMIRYHRRDALDALKLSLPDKSGEEIRDITNRMYKNFGMNIVEMLRLAGGKLEEFKERFTVDGEDIVKQALQRGKGAVILSAHLGNWDLMCMFTAKHDYRLTIISKDIKNKAINDMWMLLRKGFGISIIPSHNSARESLRALRRNEMLGFILDQNRPRDAGIFVDFFGRPACTSPGLAIFSAQAKAPVIPAFIHRMADGRHVLRVFPMIEPPADREEETIKQATQLYTKIIEDQIRAHPEQWIWLHRRWKTKPLPPDPAAAASPAQTSPG